MDDSLAVIFCEFAVLAFVIFLCWCVGRFAENRRGSFLFGFLASVFLSPLLGFFIVFLITSNHSPSGFAGAQLSGEEYLRAEQLRHQLRRTEFRWKMFSNLLYLSLFAGAAYFFYQHPEPIIRIRNAFFPAEPPPASTVTASAPQVVPTTLPPLPRDVMLTTQIQIPIVVHGNPSGSATLPRGTRLPLVSVTGDSVTVRYVDSTASIPITSTDLNTNPSSRQTTENSESPIPVAPETGAPVAVTNPAPQPQVARISGTLQTLISEGNETVARTEFEKYLRTAPRCEARGMVLRHLDDGHLLVQGSIGDPKTRSLSHQVYLLFGLPEADRLADGETFDAFAVMGDAIKTAGGGRTREFIYVDESGRRPNRTFGRNSGIYE